MWSDNETSEDLLGFKVHADLLIDVINDETVLPVTIGVFGDWGSGKSSILKIIHDKLSGEKGDLKDDTLVLYFNGWIFEGYDDAKAALLESIIESFEKHKTLGNKVKDKATKLLKSVKWMRVLGMGFKNIVVPGAAALMTGGVSLVPHLISQFSNFKPEDLPGKLTGEDSEKFLSDIIKESPEEEMRLVRQFRGDFSDMINKSKIKKLVVIIDDLDRCSPERIIENLEAIKLFLNVEKTAFIIGADPRIVRHAIEFRYKTDAIEKSEDPESRNKRIVNDYLEKLIQIPYNLPRLSDNEVETYMTLLFCKLALKDNFSKVLEAFERQRKENRYGVFGFGDIEPLVTLEEKGKLNESISLIASLSSVITEGLNGNPRQIKRFLNTFTLRNRLVKVAKIEDFRIDILAKLMVLEYSAPSLFRQLYDWQSLQSGEPEELKSLEELAETEGLPESSGKYNDWSNQKVIHWLNVNPKLSDIDLRDYYWISRDRLSSSISGASLIPAFVRILFKNLVTHGSGTILNNLVINEIRGKISENDLESLFMLLEKELIKVPETIAVHKVFIELIAAQIGGSIEAYGRVLGKVDHNKVPFSLRSDFQLAAKKNSKIVQLYKIFKKESQIYKALNQTKA